MTCPCVARHSPAIHATVTHHCVPKSWGGTDAAANLVELCDNTHRLTHERINQWRAAGGEPATGAARFSPLVRDLARRAWEGADHSRPLPRTAPHG